MDDSLQWLRLPSRDENAHKHSCGEVLVVGGSESMSGAAALVGMAALRSGAGVVKVLTSPQSQSIVARFSPCLMVGTWPNLNLKDDEFAAEWKRQLKSKPVVAIGPGLGRESILRRLVGWIYRNFEGVAVFDADGLNLLADADCELGDHAGPRILTPHLGEFRRLNGDVEWDIVEARGRAREFAKKHDVIALLKGPGTLISDGLTMVENPTGNPGMATAGSGDVLTGIISGFVAQGLSPFEGAVTGAYLHGLAGDLAAEKLSQYSVIASDLIDWLPAAIKTLLPTSG